MDAANNTAPNFLDALMGMWDASLAPGYVAPAAAPAAPAKKAPRIIGGVEVDDCPRCSGRGRIGGYEHIASGVCFRCGGSGLEKV